MWIYALITLIFYVVLSLTLVSAFSAKSNKF